MSPLWRDEVAIHVGPRKIALARHRRGFKPRLAAATEVQVPDGSIGDSGPALKILTEVLAEPGWHHADARVVVADSWVRFAIVPAPPSRLDEAGRRAHARFMLADVYGEVVADWDLVLEDGPPDAPYVACAMRSGLRPALEAALAPAHLQLVSLQPSLVVAFNAWQSRLPRNDVWFIALQDGWLSSVHVSRGCWERVQAARLSTDLTAELDRMHAYTHLSPDAGVGARTFIEAPPAIRERVRRIGSDLEWLEADAFAGGPAHELVLLMQANA